MLDLEIHPLVKIASSMVEVEFNNYFRPYHPVVAHLPMKSDVKSQGSPTIVAVGDTNKRAKDFRHVRSGTLEKVFKVKYTCVVNEIDMAVPTSRGTVHRAHLPLTCLSFRKNFAATSTRCVNRLTVSDKPVTRANDPDDTVARHVDDGYFAGYSHPAKSSTLVL